MGRSPGANTRILLCNFKTVLCATSCVPQNAICSRALSSKVKQFVVYPLCNLLNQVQRSKVLLHASCHSNLYAQYVGMALTHQLACDKILEIDKIHCYNDIQRIVSSSLSNGVPQNTLTLFFGIKQLLSLLCVIFDQQNLPRNLLRMHF